MTVNEILVLDKKSFVYMRFYTRLKIHVIANMMYVYDTDNIYTVFC